jgi:hypothetical protein
LPLAVYREIFVVEKVPFHLKNQYESFVPYTSPSTVENSATFTHGIIGFRKKGTVTLNASIRAQKADGCETFVWQSGGVGFVGVEIQNASLKPVCFTNFRLQSLKFL